MFHVINLGSENHYCLLSLEELQAYVTDNSVTQLVIFRENSFTSFAFSDTSTILVYGMAWRRGSSVSLRAADLIGIEFSDIDDVNGQFVIVNWNRKTSKLTIKTDYFGTRSLYYYKKGRSFIVAQESLVLRAVVSEKLTIDNKAFAVSLANYFPLPLPCIPTVVSNIRRVCGNCTLEFDGFHVTERNTISSIESDVLSAIELYEGHDSQALLKGIRESIFDDIALIGAKGLESSLDLSGGLDSGVLLGILKSTGNLPNSLNSLVCSGSLDIERSNLERWRSFIPAEINMIELNPQADELMYELRSGRHLDVSTAGIIHINELVKANNGGLRLVGFGPDEFMTHPIKTIASEVLLNRQFLTMGRRAFGQTIRKCVITQLPDFLIKFLYNKSIPDWISDTARRDIVSHKVELASYLRNIYNLGSVGNRIYKLNFYQYFSLQLPLNDQISIRNGVFCYYPYLNEKTLAFSHALAQRGHLSNNRDMKYQFRNIMKDVLPGYLKQHSAKNEDFAAFNRLVQQDLIRNTIARTPLTLMEHGFINKNLFEKRLNSKNIPVSALFKIYSHEEFLHAL